MSAAATPARRELLHRRGVRLEVSTVAWNAVEGVEEVHDLHVRTITSGFPALAAHVLVGKEVDCHERRREIEGVLSGEFGLEHTTLQVDHAGNHGPEGERKRLEFLPRGEEGGRSSFRSGR